MAYQPFLTWPAEYTNSISAKIWHYYICPGYDTKQSDGETLVMLEL